MPRPSRSLAVLLALAGCSRSGEPQAPRPPPSPGVAAPAPDVWAPSTGVPLPPETPYARQWLVLLHASSTPGEGAEDLRALARTGLPSAPARLSTTAFRDLRPCLEVVVAQAFATRAEAVTYQARLREAGVAADVKYAGPLEEGREAREATCLAAVEARTALAESLSRRDAPRFVESHEGRTFMLLGESQESRVLEPLDARRSVWMAPAPEDPTGLFKVGERVDLYGAEGLVKADCAVKGFAWLNRGRPAVDYFLREPSPDAPGCGQAWTFAELDCRVRPGPPLFALPSGTPAPVFFQRDAAPDAERADQEARALRRSERYLALRLEGAQWAERRGEPLREEVDTVGFSQGERRVLFSVARLRVGEGHSECGIDFDQQATRGVVSAPGAAERVVSRADLAGEDVVGVLDLEDDGQVEWLLRETWPATTLRLVREDGREVAGAVVETCDSGC
ncbi:hypothetical protein [Archangium primigenium]|uniref:hypothetical protein n=1 Tax=[Archangium] primigenium TaxID=2792470 RepID=UPI001956A8DC|nr:hypothetical protein [Archangium primigenium]MBM7118442.1 hypothetical protein [Archangium primigenium]